MKNITLSKKDFESLNIRNNAFYELDRVSDFEFSKLLEKKGWKWEKYCEGNKSKR